MIARISLGVAAICVLAASGQPVLSRCMPEQDASSAQQAPPVNLSKYAPLTPGAGDGNYVIGPPYANAPELTPRDDVPKGMVYRFTMNSTDSKIYPGISKTAPGQIVPYQ